MSLGGPCLIVNRISPGVFAPPAVGGLTGTVAATGWAGQFGTLTELLGQSSPRLPIVRQSRQEIGADDQSYKAVPTKAANCTAWMKCESPSFAR